MPTPKAPRPPKAKAEPKQTDGKKAAAKKPLEDKRSGISFQPLRHVLQPVVKHAAPKGVTGHFLQLLTLWADISRDTPAMGSHLDRLTFPKNEQQGATLHLKARDSSQALLISYDKIQLKNRINQAFGYALVNDIKVMAAPTSLSKS